MTIQNLDKNESLFDSIRKTDNSGQEFWLARDLMPVLEYDKWTNFKNVILKAKESLSRTYPQPSDHFAEVGKMIKVAAGTDKEAMRQVSDYKLTRYACYLIAQNGDPTKEAIALAQSYFAVQTRRQELNQEKNTNLERVIARKKLSETEKKFSGVLTEHGVDSRGIAEIRSAGDQALFNKDTREMKRILGTGKGRPLADYIPTITLKAKDLATEMTTFQTQRKNLQQKDPIKFEHIHNSSEVRKVLNQNGIYPEQLPAEEDIRKLERKLSQEDVKKLKTNDFSQQTELIIDLSNVREIDALQKVKLIIANNPGTTPLKIFYGNLNSLKMFTTSIQINSTTITGLRPYIVIEKTTIF